MPRPSPDAPPVTIATLPTNDGLIEPSSPIQNVCTTSLSLRP
jgi:hypothetical protein